jgi:hypothetical protein
MVNRSLADSAFRLNRDYGLNFTGKILENKLRLDVGFFNGNADSSIDNTGLRVTTKLQLDINKPPSTQGDHKRLEKPALSVGLAYSTENDVYDFDGNGIYDDNGSRWTFDLAFYWYGFNITGAYFGRVEQNADTAGPGDPFEKNRQSVGYSLQGSYFIEPLKLELVALMSYVVPDTRDARARRGLSTTAWQHESRIGAGYFINGHSLKLQADIGVIRYRQSHGSLDDGQLRVLFTISF